MKLILGMLAAAMLLGCATSRPMPPGQETTTLVTEALDLFSDARFDELADLFYYPAKYSATVRAGTKSQLLDAFGIFHRHLGSIRGEAVAFDGSNAYTLKISSARDSTWKEIEADGFAFVRSNLLVSYSTAGPGCMKLWLVWDGHEWKLRQVDVGFLNSREDAAVYLDPMQSEFLELF